MDFDLDETQQDLRTLAAEVLAKDGGEDRFRQAGLMSVCVPEEAGGAGLGPVEMAVVLREVGSMAAVVPALPTLAGTLALARHGDLDMQRRCADRVALALREPGRALAAPPLTTARRKGDGWTLTGRKANVLHPPPPDTAPATLVTADEGLFLAEPTALTNEYASTGEPAASLVFEDAPAERIAGPEAVEDTVQLFTAAVAAQASGVLSGALELTTTHVRTRKQFGRALAEFQAVTMQVADVYIAGRALDVAMWSALWRLGAGLPAERDLALAAYHVCEGLTALHTCQHLHGGLGLDVTYPLHRYFAQGRLLTHLLGGADAQLDVIGALV
ncbi:hypothetical protein SAMN05421874_102641 [Nonomuraea maritima]|uniref:Acyl-CoA dehydrogenase n=1 Tax=Nonomuraea maritima TaxID=683260 RepID=A0A1G8VLT5_9ACTN|nr:acyl-CoA dehydrogenase family protein [Nonomuraea maritima]SDJ67026.1 hypothetical protein SAMN05421874_102641 [Nonomuraea maritima]